ncbi:hypothetical protein [Paraburkholderia sp.]|uniref:hypothetical protein n=1 Tax=Paraburkholderia sp. TaxID=1926495 RepID=UPI003D6F82B5
MLRHVFIGMTLCLGVTVCVAQGAKGSSTGNFQGKWVVEDVLGYAGTSGGTPVAKRLLGETLTISPNAIDFDGDHCQPSKGFVVHAVDTASRLKADYDAYLNDFKLPSKATLLDSDNCATVFRADDYSVIFGWNGVMVRAYRDK